VVTYLRRGKTAGARRGVSRCERNNPADTQVSEEGGGGGAPEQAPGRSCGPMGDARWTSLLLKDCSPWKGPTLE